MKKVPKYIQNEMKKAAEHINIANQHICAINAWLWKNGIDPDNLRPGDGCGLDELDYGNGERINFIVDNIESILNGEEQEEL